MNLLIGDIVYSTPGLETDRELHTFVLDDVRVDKEALSGLDAEALLQCFLFLAVYPDARFHSVDMENRLDFVGKWVSPGVRCGKCIDYAFRPNR